MFKITCVFAVGLLHFAVINPSEKILARMIFGAQQFLFRPGYDACSTLECLGMPSGHAEVSTVVLLLLSRIKLIPLYICIVIAALVGLQRIWSSRHTWGQVIAGWILGGFYSTLYSSFGII
jgi:membrane-associated phospholipid phosphatase